MNRTSITIVVVVILCAVGFAYSQGWFDWRAPAAEMESNKVSTTRCRPRQVESGCRAGHATDDQELSPTTE